MTDQTLATLKDREKEIGPVREDSRELLSLWAIYLLRLRREKKEMEKDGAGEEWEMWKKIANIY